MIRWTVLAALLLSGGCWAAAPDVPDPRQEDGTIRDAARWHGAKLQAMGHVNAAAAAALW